MNNIEEQSISPVTETLTMHEQRDLLNVVKQTLGIISPDDYIQMLAIMHNAIDRMLKDNGIID